MPGEHILTFLWPDNRRLHRQFLGTTEDVSETHRNLEKDYTNAC